MQKKALFGILFVSVLILGVAASGCISGEKTSTGTTGQSDSTATGKVVELEFWHGIEAPENQKVLEELVRKFEAEHPNIKIKLVNYGAQDKAVPKIMAAAQAGTPPDLVWLNPAQTGFFAEAGVLAPVEDFIKNDPSFNKEDIYEGLWELGTYKGKIYTAPFDTNNLAIYYNKELFREAGLDPEAYMGKALSWDEFRELAKKLTKDKDGDGEIDQYGFMVPFGRLEWTVWTWEVFLWSAGGELLSEDQSKPTFASDAGVKALQYWVDLVYKDKVAKLSEPNAGYKLDDFFAGRVAMTINGPWNYPVLKEQGWLDKTGVMLMPYDKRIATNIGGENLFIFKTTPEREQAAWEFAKFVMSPEFQVTWALKTGYLPVCKSALEDPEYKKFLEENPFIKIYVENLQYGKARPPVPQYPDMSAAIGEAIEAALLQKKDPATALKEAQAKVEPLFKS
ncbi:ABC transporter substrate-binding protein [Thermococcus gorgonarius]|uniref:Sugar-binding protein n=1 Tax=Thermococcus gorgonarius TaxID=71997 RepID=A0A2Z2MAD0_THEGO|nr:ABC transporter substrate-binding protein [Thermococcus gorgonarius]ASJ01465.1 sugar-binding protein [Thermococcus gorgonarius]